MRVVNTYALSQWNKSPYKCLQTEYKDNKKNYIESCLQQHHHFYPFVVPMDDLLGMEAETTLKRISIRLATKWKQPYSRTCG